jgi:YggT family protein
VFIIANFLLALAKITDIVLTLYLYILIARALLSWVNPDPYNPIVSFLYRVTEPVLYRVRRVMPDMGGIDLSPMLIMLGIFFIQKFAINSVYELAYRLKMPGGF